MQCYTQADAHYRIRSLVTTTPSIDVDIPTYPRQPHATPTHREGRDYLDTKLAMTTTPPRHLFNSFPTRFARHEMMTTSVSI